jgi:acid phosphatase type 7
VDSAKRDAVANFTAYNHRFRMPSAGSNGTMNMWYSFEYGSVHFTMFSAETDYPDAPNDDYSSKNGNFGNQMAWIEADLANAAQRRAKGEISWIIAAAHRPVYSMNEIDTVTGLPGGSAAKMQAAFEPLFAKYGVDAYLSGHVHGTEVHWPVFNGTNVQKTYNNPEYTTYFVVGGAGCDEGLTAYGNLNNTLWSNFWDGSNYGLTTMTFEDSDTMTWNFRRATDGSVLKSVTLVRQH